MSRCDEGLEEVLPDEDHLPVGEQVIGLDASEAIEVSATHALGVETQLDKAKIGIFSGQFRLAGLAFFHKGPKPDSESSARNRLRRHRVQMGAAPARGGFTAAASMRF